MITYSALGTMGRLGNHLFQIASTIGIADKLNTDVSFPKWKYEESFKNPLPHKDIADKVTIKETNFTYDEPLLNSLIPGKTNDLHGWFQSEKYWQQCKPKVFEQFQFTNELKSKVKFRFAGALLKKNVAISVRRGDFVDNPNYFQIPITYYLNAYYKHFGAEYNVLLFSDDIDYCKTHFKALPNVYFADGLDDIEQLCLMSMCENHIISNSTFSWWGAYLSKSTNVIRPEKNFAGPLAKMNSEKDYWPAAWKVFNDYQIDLSDTTFIIPVYYDHNDRMQNVMLTLSFLNTYFNTNIIIGEQGGSKFKCLDEYADYVQFNYTYFHRTKMINELAKMASTSIVINWDCDNVCPPAQLAEAVNSIRNGSDIAYPFDGTVYRVPRCYFNHVANALDVNGVNVKHCVTKHSSVGHAVVMNKDSFIKSGMENENFISWGPEDSERFQRYNILGLTVQRIPGGIYHMDHYIGENSSFKNEFFSANESEYLNVSRKTKEQLTDYIAQWKWVS